jgi:hypothetical protein
MLPGRPHEPHVFDVSHSATARYFRFNAAAVPP